MTAHQILFYIIAAAILVAGFLSVTSPRIFRSAIYLLFSLLGIAGLYFWMDVDFIAAVQISVYVGGIVVLIIFSIFLTEQAGKESRQAHPLRTLFSALAALLGMVLSFLVISKYAFKQSGTELDFSIYKVGHAFLNYGEGGYTLPFEVISILLLAAMVGCIVVAMKSKVVEPGETKNIDQNSNEEIK